MQKDYDNKNVCYDMQALHRMLPIGKNKLYEIVHSKGFPKITVGRRILVPKKAFDEWLEKAADQQMIIS